MLAKLERMMLLAVSGGIDSMYLMHKAPWLFPGASFAVAHCNFSLRADESDGDEEFVRSACRERGLPCLVRRFDTSAYARGKGISIEMAARELRYAWFSALCNGTAPELSGTGLSGFEAVAVAHNANDNAETLLLNLVRGCGMRGLCGMSEKGIVPGSDGIPLLRPLLGLERGEIAAWMKKEGHGWREDSSNAQSDCRRNLLRNEVFPLLQQLNPSLIATLRQDIRHFAEGNAIAESYWEAFAAQTGGCARKGIDIDVLLGYTHWKYLLWHCLEPYGFSLPTFGKLISLLESYTSEPRGSITISGKSFESPLWVLNIKRKKLTLSPR